VGRILTVWYVAWCSDDGRERIRDCSNHRRGISQPPGPLPPPGRPRTPAWCASDAPRPPNMTGPTTNPKVTGELGSFSLALMESRGARWDPEFGDDAGTRLVRRPYL
jgi:hypothetical protein